MRGVRLDAVLVLDVGYELAKPSMPSTSLTNHSPRTAWLRGFVMRLVAMRPRGAWPNFLTPSGCGAAPFPSPQRFSLYPGGWRAISRYAAWPEKRRRALPP